MKKHTTTAGPIGTRRIRSLLAFRHHNPIARLMSMLVAVAMAMFLVAGTGAAYADDAAPAETATETAAAEPAEEPTEEAEAPAEEPAEEPASDDGSADAPAEGGDEGGGAGGEPSDSADTQEAAGAEEPAASGPMMTTLKKLVAEAAPVDVTVPCGDSDADVLVGGFEIDGDLCVNNAGEDWDSVDFASDAADFTVDGFDDDTSFTQGDSENNDPSTWHIDGPTPNGKTDIGTAYAYSQAVGDDVFGYFAFTNSSTAGGTQQYDVEYNQNEATENANGATVAVREPGDLLFRFASTGNDPLVFVEDSGAMIYTLESSGDWSDTDCFPIIDSDPAGGWCVLPIPPDAFHADASDDGLFQEGSIEISAFFAEGDCSGVFGTTQIRSVTGNAFETSALKDYVFPLNVTTPSTCGSLTIEKRDAVTDELVPGAVFCITDDPRPGETGTYCVFDGVEADIPDAAPDGTVADGNADGVVEVGEVEPGTYTVEEVVAPPGYLLSPEPPGNSQEVTIEESESVTLTFANYLQWQPLNISKTAAGTFSALYTWSLNKQIGPTENGPWSDGTTPGDPLLKDIEAGGDTNLYYQVVVTEEEKTTSDYVVSGTIHVDNPNDAAVTATINESLAGCTIDGGADPVTVDVPAGGADYPYTCDLGDGPVDPGTNTATVTWDRSDYPQSVEDIGAEGNFSDDGSDGYTFEETVSVDETITVTDDHFVFDPEWVITWGDEPDGVYESGVYSFDTETVAGTCSEVITNTATITGDESTLDQDSESGQVCVEVGLEADLTVSESFTRTFLWNIVKDTTTPGPINVANGQVSAHYVVTVEALPYADSAWAMLGTVTITNSNDFADKQVSDLDVEYSGGGTCVLDDPLPNVPMATEGTPGSAVVDFHCNFTEEPAYDGDVTATVKWDADAESTDDQVSVTAADWVKTLVDEFVKVFDDHAVPGTKDPLFGGIQLKWQDVFDSVDPAAHKVDVEYDHVYSGAILPAAGTCKDLVNTAWLTHGADLLLDSDTATVNVCTPAVVVLPPTPPQVSPPNTLPNTGGPDALLLAAGLVLLLGGGTLVIGDRLRRRRS